MDKAFIVREGVFELQHLSGGTPDRYRDDALPVIADTVPKERSSSSKGIPYTQNENHAICNTPCHYTDRPNQSPVRPVLAESKDPLSTTFHCTQGVSPKAETTQTHLMDKFKQNLPINRGLIKTVQEPSPWKPEKRRRVENAIRRVNNNYVVNPRTYQEPDFSERVDNQFMPTPPPGLKPNVRRNNRMIVDAEKLRKERGLKRGEFAPSRSSMHVQENVQGIVVQHVPCPPNRPAPFLAIEQTVDRSGFRAQKKCYRQYDRNTSNYEMSCERPGACTSYTAVSERPQAWCFQHNQKLAHDRIQQEYVDELRSGDDVEEPTSSQAEIGLDFKRQALLAKKEAKKERRRKRTELLTASLLDGEDDLNRVYRYIDDVVEIQAFVPAPPVVRKATQESYSKRKRQVRQQKALSGYVKTPDLMTAANQIENGCGMQPHVPAPPKTSNGKSDPYSRNKRHKRQIYGHSEYGTSPEGTADSSRTEQKGDMQPHVPVPPTTRYNTSDSYTKRSHQYRYDNSQSTYGTTSELIAGISTAVQENQTINEPKQIPGSNRPSQGAVIRVEPQLTWNTSAAKRGLGFKSKLRREQEEDALYNTSHHDDNDTHKKP